MRLVYRNALLLAGGLVFQSGMVQLAVALGTVTIVTVTGIEGILGLGPAVFLLAGALAVGPAGRLSDRVGRMPVIRGGFVLGIIGPAVTAGGCAADSGWLVFLGLGLCGAAQAIVLLSRAAAAEMFPPARRARGMSIVLFGVVSGAVWGPLVFGPMFSGRELTADDLVVPWLAASAFTAVGLALSFGVRPDPQEMSRAYADQPTGDVSEVAAPLSEILRRPGVLTAMIGAVASFAVMVGVMNLSGYIAVGHGHSHGDVFTIISVHIVGMYGLVLVVGDLVERIGRRESIVIGLAIMAVSNLGLVWSTGIPAMSVSLFGLGWNLAYVAANTELVSLAEPAERGRLIGFTDLLSSGIGAALALGGGVIYSAGGSVPLALTAVALATLPALVAAVPPRRPHAPRLAD